VLLQLFLPCYIANEIKVCANNYCRDVFACNWIEFNAKDKKALLFLMTNLSQPIKIEILKISDVNLETFMNVS